MNGFFKIFVNLCGGKTFTDTDFPINPGPRETIRHYGDGARIKIPLRPTGLSNEPRASYHERIKRSCETLRDAFDQDELKGNTQLRHSLKKWRHEGDGRYMAGRKAASAIIESAFSKRSILP